MTSDFNSTPSTLSQDKINAIIIQPDGKIVAVGVHDANPINPDSDFAIARFNADGSPDNSFGTNGKTVTSFSTGGDRASAAALQSDGKIVAAGVANGQEFVLARYTPNGQLDTTFGNGGKIITTFESGTQAARAVVIQPDGKLIAGGYSQRRDVATLNAALVRYTASGQLDTTFGNSGKLVINEFGCVSAMAQQSDGRVIAAGYKAVPDSTGTVFAILRLWP